MKKISITILSFAVCHLSFSQVNSPDGDRKTQNNSREAIPIETVKVDNTSVKEVKIQNQTQTISKRAGEEQRVHDENYYLQEIATIEQNITSIAQKTEYINSIPEEKALAESNGWFEQMDEIKSQMLARKIELQEQLNKLK